MRRAIRYMMLMPVLMAQALSSCSLIDEPVDDGEGNVTASLAFTVSSSAGAPTRMADAVVQEKDSDPRYRGLDLIALIPFSKQGNIESDDRPLRLFDGTGNTVFLKTTGVYGGFYLYEGFSMMRGTASFLVYGKAPNSLPEKPSGVSKEAFYGSLVDTIPASQSPADISFSPEQVLTSTDVPAEASLIAGYLNYIAGAQVTEGGETYKWSGVSDSKLKAFYLNFTGQKNNGNVLMAGSSTNIIHHVNALYQEVSGLTFEDNNSVEARIAANILSRITTYTATGLSLAFTGNQLTSLGVDYPSNGLPDGAAALQWAKRSESSTDFEFLPQTQTTTTANVNSITRYCYPIGLYYYANSRIDTSNKDDTKPYSTATEWGDVLAEYENKNGQVSGNTVAIAIQDPLQYAVGRLKLSMKAGSSTLKDAADEDVTLTSTTFPLTGIIVCNQHTVGFDFKPLLDEHGEASHVDDCFIYDSQVGSTCYLTDSKVNLPSTLVLQSYDDEVVTIALEFRNNSRKKFYGENGIIYPGTKFYLIGQIEPDKFKEPDDDEDPIPDKAKGRVFTQDFITSVSTEVKSLAKAYNVLPDILGGRLEIGIELTPKWYFTEPEIIVFD